MKKFIGVPRSDEQASDSTSKTPEIFETCWIPASKKNETETTSYAEFRRGAFSNRAPLPAFESLSNDRLCRAAILRKRRPFQHFPPTCITFLVLTECGLGTDREGNICLKN